VDSLRRGFLDWQRCVGLAVSPLVQESEIMEFAIKFGLILWLPLVSMIFQIRDGVDEIHTRFIASGGRTRLSRAYLVGRESYARLRAPFRKTVRGVVQ
jgi:hypothetical protein